MPDVQIEASVLFGIAWVSFAVFFLGALAGTVLLGRAYRLALAIFVVATVGGFTFSFLAGFSIGRFTAILPLVITAFAVTHYRDPRLQLAAQAAAIGIYVLLPGSLPNRFTSGESSSSFPCAWLRMGPR